MKKIFILLVAVIMLFAFAACDKEETKAEKYCWNCGEGVSKTVSFCSNCGASVKTPGGDKDNETTTEDTTDTQKPAETQDTTETQKPADTQDTTETQKPADTEKPAETQKPAHTHSYSKRVTAPTCTERGYTTYTCSCGSTYTADEVSAKGHSYNQKVTAPTCTERGYTTYTCSCGYTYIANEVSAKGHSYNQKVTAPTCTASGYTTYTCSCGHTYTADEVAAKGHSHSKNVTPPTCTERGYTTYTCSCGSTYTADEVVAKGHSHTPSVTPPTCTERGYTTYICSCGDTYRDNYTNPSHNYSNYKCTRCGTIDKSHAYDYLMAWVIEHGTTNGTYTKFNYISGSNTYAISYSSQYNNLSVDKYSVQSGGGKYITSLQLDSNFYGCTVFWDIDDTETEMCGYINPSIFTSNTAISYTVYNGDPSLKSSMAELSRASVCELIAWLEWCLVTNNVGVTIKDLGFTSF